jgi:protoporphyrinogen oxidase
VRHDAIVLGAGPAGLGAALALARAGARVALVEASGRVGGLCVTLRSGELGYDLGGHILFVHDEARRVWLEELLGSELVWVERPVVCVRDGRRRPGRYLDQRPDQLPEPNGSGPSARDFLAGRFGADFVDRVMRRYLEKVDGIPLERIAAARARKLLVEQFAPDGFWYAAGGIGQLMDAMAAELVRLGGELLLGTRVRGVRVDGGRVSGVDVDTPSGPATLAAPLIVAGLPPAYVAKLVEPAAPRAAVPDLPPRAAVVVVVEVDRDRLTEEPWIQVDDPDVPFARMYEPKNWSARLVPPGRTVVGCECYCSPTPDDRFWGLDDESLGRACIDAIAGPLGLLGGARAGVVDTIRLPRAWTLTDVDHLDAAAAPGRWLAQIDGLRVAQGGDVVLAIAAGEAAAAA